MTLIRLNHYNPGMFEVFCGPMKCDKTTHLLHTAELLNRHEYPYVVFNPEINKRPLTLRKGFADPVNFDQTNPIEILDYLQNHYTSDSLPSVIIIDEVMFCADDISLVVETLTRKGCNVVAAGLDLDFRGEPFGCMRQLLPLADQVYKLTAACSIKGCRAKATRTQRLINGEAAHYDSPIILVEGSGDEVYEPRCVEHHEVPGRLNGYSHFTL